MDRAVETSIAGTFLTAESGLLISRSVTTVLAFFEGEAPMLMGTATISGDLIRVTGVTELLFCIVDGADLGVVRSFAGGGGAGSSVLSFRFGRLA